MLCSANFLISSATTEKPLPASPALAASIAAFSARRFVCSDILLIISVISVTVSILDFILYIELLNSLKDLLNSFMAMANFSISSLLLSALLLIFSAISLILYMLLILVESLLSNSSSSLVTSSNSSACLCELVAVSSILSLMLWAPDTNSSAKAARDEASPSITMELSLTFRIIPPIISLLFSTAVYISLISSLFILPILDLVKLPFAISSTIVPILPNLLVIDLATRYPNIRPNTIKIIHTITTFIWSSGISANSSLPLTSTPTDHPVDSINANPIYFSSAPCLYSLAPLSPDVIFPIICFIFSEPFLSLTVSNSLVPISKESLWVIIFPSLFIK